MNSPLKPEQNTNLCHSQYYRDLLPVERVLTRVEKQENGCWLWVGKTKVRGYGRLSINNKMCLVHRITYEYYKGPIPEGYEIDHLCRVRNCVNPTHLEAVTPYINNLRGFSFSAINARKTHCPQGHPYDEANTYMRTSTVNRQCKTCMLLQRRIWSRKKRRRNSLNKREGL